MQIEPHVVSREIAKKLKEAGYPQEDSLFYWAYPDDPRPQYKNMGSIVVFGYDDYKISHHFMGCSYKTCVAPISDEILEKLPKNIKKYDVKYLFSIMFCKYGVILLGYGDGEEGEFVDGLYLETKRNFRSCDALASLWLKLKEGGYIESN